MIKPVAQIYMTEAEVARDLHAALERVEHGVQVVIERDHQPIALIKSPEAAGRSIDECIALAQAYEA